MLRHCDRIRSGIVTNLLRSFVSTSPSSDESEYCTKLKFTEPSELAPIRVYRTFGDDGVPLTESDSFKDFNKSLARRIYETIVKTRITDSVFYDAQRQGRISFYLTSYGEEAVSIASAAALDRADEYREQGFLIWRGFTIRQMADQCCGNKLEEGKARQMPIHYGSAPLHVHTISSTLATQIPHSVGAAFALKMEKRENVAVCFFGDGAASEGDFHASLNFAATLGVPVLFICRNNGYAISTPSSEQFKSYCVAVRGPGYGVPTLRVDGGDPRAIYLATKLARERCLQENCPVLLEAMCYRFGHHSTSDDSSRYRTQDETQSWKRKEPVARFRSFLYSKNWWTENEETQLTNAIREEAIKALEDAEKVEKPPVSTLFTDVYHQMPWHLKEQQNDLDNILSTSISK